MPYVQSVPIFGCDRFAGKDEMNHFNEIDIVYPDIDFSGVEAVLIDIDDTLYRYDRCHLHAIAVVANHAVRSGDWKPRNGGSFVNEYGRYRKIITKRLHPQGACRSRLLAFLEMLEDHEIPGPHSKSLVYERLYWESFMEKMIPAPAAIRFLQETKRRGISCVVVSDMETSWQIRKLEKLNLIDRINALVTSEEAGSEKPGRAIFELAIQKAKTTPEKAIMVGDSYEKDIQGAHSAGIRAYLVAPGAKETLFPNTDERVFRL